MACVAGPKFNQPHLLLAAAHKCLLQVKLSSPTKQRKVNSYAGWLVLFSRTSQYNGRTSSHCYSAKWQVVKCRELKRIVRTGSAAAAHGSRKPSYTCCSNSRIGHACRQRSNWLIILQASLYKEGAVKTWSSRDERAKGNYDFARWNLDGKWSNKFKVLKEFEFDLQLPIRNDFSSK